MSPQLVKSHKKVGPAKNRQRRSKVCVSVWWKKKIAESQRFMKLDRLCQTNFFAQVWRRSRFSTTMSFPTEKMKKKKAALSRCKGIREADVVETLSTPQFPERRGQKERIN